MLLTALRDLSYRARRVAVTIIGASLVFALTIALSGLSAAFTVEVEDTIASMPLDGWVVDAASSGPLVSASPVPGDTVELVRGLPGVEDAGGMALGRATVDLGRLTEVVLLAAEPGRPGMPAADRGVAPRRTGDVMVSSRLGLDLGDELTLGDSGLVVVGIKEESSVFAGLSTAFLTLADGQALAFAGLPVVTSIAVRGVPRYLPDGLASVDRTTAVEELIRPVEQAQSTVALVSVLLWVIAALIIGAVVYLSVLERLSDFAVFKATGWSDRSLLGGVAFQAAALALVSSLLGAGMGTLLAPVFPMRVEIPTDAYLRLPVLAVAVGLAASAAGLRRITKVDPAAAFG